MTDHKLQRFSAVLLIAGEVVYQVAQQFHGGSGATAQEVFAAYAGSPTWALVHAAQFAGSALVIFGMLALVFALNTNSGIQGAVSRFAAASAAAALALNGALYAVDGIALKQAVDAWVSAPLAEQSALYAVVQGIRGVEWGMRGYAGFTTGLALALLGIAIASTARIPRPIGYILGLAGLAYIVQGYGFGTFPTAISQNQTLNPASYQVLIVLGAIWILVSTWRRKEAAQAVPA